MANEKRSQFARHPRRRRQPAGLRRVLARLRPADDLRREEARRTARSPTTTPSSSPSLPRAGRSRADGKSVTFKLRKDAKFHDGTPVTAEDVKWSFDRAVIGRRLPDLPDEGRLLESRSSSSSWTTTPSASTSCATDKLTLPDLGRAGSVHHQFRGREEERHRRRSLGASSGLQDQRRRRRRLQASSAGSPARRSSTRASTTGSPARCRRSGASISARCRRPATAARCSSGRRRHVLRRCRPRTSTRCRRRGKVKVVGTPIENAIWYLGMNVTRSRSTTSRSARPIAYAMPYEQIMRLGDVRPRHADVRRRRQHGQRTDWPQPYGYETDLDKAKALLAEAGHAGRASRPTLSFDLGTRTIDEPTALLIQESARRRSASR